MISAGWIGALMAAIRPHVQIELFPFLDRGLTTLSMTIIHICHILTLFSIQYGDQMLNVTQ
jgi:hypothetical protein